MAAVASPHSNGIGNGISETTSPKDKNFNGVKREVKEESESEDDTPWADRLSSEPKNEDTKRPIKRELSVSASPEPPKKSKKDKGKEKKKHKEEKKSKKQKKKSSSDEESPYDEESDEEDFVPEKKSKSKKESKSPSKKAKVEVIEAKPQKKRKAVKEEPSSQSPTKRKKKAEEEEDIWRWWEEEKKPDGIKWNTLEHKGPLFAPAYVPLPKSVKFLYNGKEVKLSEEAEEVATFYASMLDHEYTSKKVFNDNFFKDWRKTMTSAEKELITDLSKCNFKHIQTHFQEQREIRLAMSKEEKQKIKLEKEAEAKEYGFATIDGHKQKIGNFRIEPPGLFRGRGDHPKMGKLKKRINPRDVIINCGKGTAIPTPPPGHKWKEVRHDNTVSWLCSWTENVLGNNKYIMLNPSSKMKGEKDFEKFENCRRLKKIVGDIRKDYTVDLKDREMRIRQRAVAIYFIDKLALRAGNEKDTEEAADTVGCCSLRVEHVKLHDELDGKKYVVEFDFLGKDSIRYFNQVPVEKQVFKNLKMFKENKDDGDDLFDRLDTSTLNAHLRSLMPGLTAKVFRTYNASITLQNQLDELTDPKATVNEKMLSYNRANRMVAVLCNHQRAVPKTHEKSMENLENKIKDKKAELKEAKADLASASRKDKEKAEKKVDRLKDQLKRLKIQRTDKDENKQIALGTSKLNYLDPRISVAWCKKYDVPIEKVFNKTQREKFRWAIDMATEDYVF